MPDINPRSFGEGIKSSGDNTFEKKNLSKKSKKLKSYKIFWALVILVVVVVILFLLTSKVASLDILNLFKVSTVAPIEDQVVSSQSEWQAVFLSNGQVYFGKLSNTDSNYPVLKDIYYLQVQKAPIQPAQPAAKEEGVQPAEKIKQQLILIKFGTELHKPTDEMHINKDHILFFENLEADSSVVKAIENYKIGKK